MTYCRQSPCGQHHWKFSHMVPKIRDTLFYTPPRGVEFARMENIFYARHKIDYCRYCGVQKDMYRFVELGDQIYEDMKLFAIYDTVTDTFVDIGPNRVWRSREDFITDYRYYDENIEHLQRFLNIIPEDR